MRLIILMLLIPLNVFAQTKTVTCVPPTEREDGTALPAAEISHYLFYISDGTLGTYPNVVRADTCQITVDLLSVKRHVGATTVDTDGRESSRKSNIITLPAITVANPKPPRINATVQ
jgi:hypothetical protein